MTTAWARVDPKFWDHPKVKQCSNSALGLWVKANAFCRDHRTGGYISREDILSLGTIEEVNELFNAKLWIKEPNGARFKDYSDWNSDIDPDTEAGRMVSEYVPSGYPSAVRRQLVKQAAALISEGIDVDVVEGSVRLWMTKKLGPTLLPSLCSDVLRDRERHQSLKNTLRDCLKDGSVSPLKAYGFIFDPPIPPDDLSLEERRAFFADAKREWLRQLWENL